MPKEISAKVMFDAVNGCVIQRGPRKRTLTDIRFAIIDDPTVDVEFINFLISFSPRKNSHLQNMHPTLINPRPRGRSFDSLFF